MNYFEKEKEILSHLNDVLEFHGIKNFIVITEFSNGYQMFTQLPKEDTVLGLWAELIGVTFPTLAPMFEEALKEDDGQETDLQP